MAKLNEKLLSHLKELSMLEFPEEEAKKILDQLSRIVAYVEKINELDLEGIEPSPYPIPIRLRMEPDEEERFERTESIIGLFPDREGRLLKAPKILEGEE